MEVDLAAKGLHVAQAEPNTAHDEARAEQAFCGARRSIQATPAFQFANPVTGQ
jgi:hypothetical protein